MNLTAPESLIFWTTIIFLVFFYIMAKFAWKPILNAVKKREDSINDALAAAETAKNEMLSLQENNERLLKEARAERDAMLKDAREIKEKMIADAKVEAEKQGEQMIGKAKAIIESEKVAAMSEIKNQVSELSVQIAEELMKKELSDQASQKQLIEKMLSSSN